MTHIFPILTELGVNTQYQYLQSLKTIFLETLKTDPGPRSEPGSGPGELYMKQRIQWLETLTAGMYENMNIYDVHSKPPETKSGRRGSFLAETKVAQVLGHSTECERNCCHPGHSLMLHVNDNEGNTMVTIERPGGGTGKFCLNQGACMDVLRAESRVRRGRGTRAAPGGRSRRRSARSSRSCSR